MLSHVRRSFLVAVVGACILHAAPARADITSFLSAGGGAGVQRDGVAKSSDAAGNMTFALGVDNVNNDKYFLYHPFPQRSLFMQVGWKL